MTFRITFLLLGVGVACGGAVELPEPTGSTTAKDDTSSTEDVAPSAPSSSAKPSSAPLPEGATRTSDGAPGFCCPPATGGCAMLGGYQTSGTCKNYICDNMCEQRIVEDVHGCKKMVYKIPPVQTTFAGTGSCTDPIFNGSHYDGGVDGSKDGGAD